LNKKGDGSMVSVGRCVKVWIFITLCSLLIWTANWIPSSLSRIQDFVFGGLSLRFGWMYIWMEVSGATAIIVRFVGVLIGLLILFLLRDGAKRIFEVRKWLTSALILESLFYAMSGFPSGIYMMGSGYGGQYRTLGVSFFLQFLFTTPFLAILAIKVYRYKQDSNGFKSWKWAGVAFVGYIAALWASSVLKWFEMVAAEGIAFFSVAIRAVGALNGFVFMSLAVVFAIVGAFSLVKKKRSAMRWLGLALAMVGLHYLVFVVYSYYGSMLNFALLAEVWAIPLLGLGLTMLKTKLSKNE
jgi:hypothetical protein